MPPPVADKLQSLRGFAWRVGRRFVEDRCTRAAAALSYTTVLALVPLTVVAFALLTALPASEALMARAQAFVYGNFVPATGEVVLRYLEQFAANAARLTAWSLLLLAVTAILLVSTIERTFNDIWHTPHPRGRMPRFLALGTILVLGPIMIGVILSLASFVFSLPLFARSSTLGILRMLVREGLPVAFELIAFVMIYMLVPSRPVRLRHALVGAAVAVILFELAKHGFGYFVAHFSSHRVVYGALATLPVLLVWIYLSWTVVLLGALVTAELPCTGVAAQPRRRSVPRRAPEVVRDAGGGTESARKKR